MKFSIEDFFSQCDQIRSFLRIWSHLLKKFCVQCYLKIRSSHNLRKAGTVTVAQDIFSILFILFSSIYNLPDFALIFLKDLLTKLKARMNQQELILLQLETVWYIFSKTSTKNTWSFANTMSPWYYSTIARNCVILWILLVMWILFITMQQTKSGNNRYPRYPDHLFLYRVWFQKIIVIVKIRGG